MRKNSTLIKLFSLAFVLFTSVHCEKNYTCAGRVLDADTHAEIDSAIIVYTRGEMFSNKNGFFELNNQKTFNRPSISIVKEGYKTQKHKDCRQIKTIYLEH